MTKNENININLEEINNILSETLRKVVDRKISLKQANAISKLTSTLTKIISTTELKNRIEIIEEVLKERK